MQVVISVCTYRRPDDLRRLLESIELECSGVSYRVVVVDNDSDASARAIVSFFGHTYLVEPAAGIAQARNRGLEQLTEDDDFVVFVDDDEVVTPGWLQALLALQAETGAAIVTGPVVTVFPPEAPRWIVRGGFIQRRRFPTGTRLDFAATNNTMVSAPLIRSSGIRFDPQFSITGGSDTDFFDRLRPHAGRAIWHDEAVVWEDAPPNRLSLRWIVRRSIRGGNVLTRIQRRTRSRTWIACDASLRVAYFLVRALAHSVTHTRAIGPDIQSAFYNVGRIAALFGQRVTEYSR